MKIALETAGACLIEASEPGRVRIAGRFHTASVLVAPDRGVSPWSPTRVDELAADDFAAVIEYRPQVVIIGTGTELRFPPAQVLQPLIGAGIGHEIMATDAACRTYNLIASEGRRVIGALMLGELAAD